MVEHRLDEGVSVNAETGAEGSESHESDASDEDADGTTGDRIITASGEVVEVGGSGRMMEDDQGQLVELYEAQALAANPFLVAPRSSGSGNQSSTGAPTVAALLLDHMSGMAAVSFTQKAMESGMLTQEGRRRRSCHRSVGRARRPGNSARRPSAAPTTVGVLGVGLVLATAPHASG